MQRKAIHSLHISPNVVYVRWQETFPKDYLGKEINIVQCVLLTKFLTQLLLDVVLSVLRLVNSLCATFTFSNGFHRLGWDLAEGTLG